MSHKYGKSIKRKFNFQVRIIIINYTPTSFCLEISAIEQSSVVVEFVPSVVLEVVSVADEEFSTVIDTSEIGIWDFLGFSEIT